MLLSNKHYSNKQESLVSTYLGWSKVSGSGSRNFHPGDVCSEQWLGECKTKTSISNRIVFKFDDWDKLSEEAKSQFKYPVLFTDNGSQTAENTWCLIDVTSVFVGNLDAANDRFTNYSNQKSVSYELKSLQNHEVDDFIFARCGSIYAVLSLHEFKEFSKVDS